MHLGQKIGGHDVCRFLDQLLGAIRQLLLQVRALLGEFLLKAGSLFFDNVFQNGRNIFDNGGNVVFARRAAARAMEARRRPGDIIALNALNGTGQVCQPV